MCWKREGDRELSSEMGGREMMHAHLIGHNLLNSKYRQVEKEDFGDDWHG